jgi:predicted protein tyrosine phosphatase
MAGKKILAVCSANVNRSNTAAWLMKLMDSKDEVWSRGSNQVACRIHGGNYCTSEDLNEADSVICMEERNRKELVAAYGSGCESKIIVLGIPDKFKFMDSKLIFELLMKL